MNQACLKYLTSMMKMLWERLGRTCVSLVEIDKARKGWLGSLNFISGKERLGEGCERSG